MKEIVEEDRMDLSKARQLRQDNQRHRKLACKRKEAETTNTPVKRSFSVFQNSENTNPPGKLSFTELSVVENTNSPAKRNLSVVQREQCLVTFSYKGSFDIEEYRNYAKEEKQMSVDFIQPLQDQAIVWVPPPPPDPHNPT
ncbi:uncharacterized protein LOC127705564 isoform X2 [Mytilus californianus]|uniref:uncharacterized protein LOC127705564 isoform X2 n=1 Tax=Mytilus californianus TaxID=6549 RepID=UPI00224664B3|nr:uncharacterized protein LOC127705564 isoform X2 [Mytilus californianus]